MKKYQRASDIKVGVVGYGGAFNMGKVHLEEMRKAGMTPTAVAEIDPSRLAVATQDFPNIQTYASLPSMLAGLGGGSDHDYHAAQHACDAGAPGVEGRAARGVRKANGDQDRGVRRDDHSGQKEPRRALDVPQSTLGRTNHERRPSRSGRA